MRRTLQFLLLIAALPGPVVAQTTVNGSVRGTARDQNGAALPGVAMPGTRSNVFGGFSATTDGVGRYRLIELPPGEYTLVADLAGFARLVRTPVTLRAGLNLELDFVMTIGDVSETVEVRQD